MLPPYFRCHRCAFILTTGAAPICSDICVSLLHQQDTNPPKSSGSKALPNRFASRPSSDAFAATFGRRSIVILVAAWRKIAAGVKVLKCITCSLLYRKSRRPLTLATQGPRLRGVKDFQHHGR